MRLYDAALVAWTPDGFSPMPVSRGLRSDGAACLDRWEQDLLRTPKVADRSRRALDMRRPLLDPILHHDPEKYSVFLTGMPRRGIIDFVQE